MDENQLNDIFDKEMIKRLKRDVPSTQEVADLISQIISAVQEAKAHMEKMMMEHKMQMDSDMKSSLEDCMARLDAFNEKLEKKAEKVLENVQKNVKIDVDQITVELYKELQKIKDLIPPATDLSDIFQKLTVLENKPVILPTPEQTRDAIESLKGEERTDKSAIKGIEAIEEKIKSIELRPSSVIGGPRGIQLYVDGVKEGQAGTVNFIAGSGVSLVYARSHGRNDITISASGGAMTVLAATGTINDTNVTFTVASEPTLAIINGISYRTTGGAITWSYLAGTVTLSQPVGTGGDIYFIS